MSDKSVVEQIKHYQRDIIKCPENAKRMIRCIERLMVLPVTIAHLQETGVGRSVNELRKCGGEVGAAANSLVCKWKSMVQADEDSEVESEVEEDEPKETLVVSSPDIRASPSIKNESVDKYKNDSVDKYKKNHGSEEYKKPKSDHSSKKSESSHSENRLKNSDKKSMDKHDHKSHRNKSSKSEHGSGSDSKHSSSHRSKSDHNSRSKSHSSQRSDSEYNGDIKTERPSSKTRHDDNKIKSSSESKIKDVKQKSDKDKHRREESSHRSEKENRRRDESSHRSVSSSSSKKYDVRKIESESSDDDNVYKPRSKKRKKSESEEDRKSDIRSRRKSESEEDEKYHNDKYSGRSKHRESIKHESSEESDARNASEGDETSRPSSRYSETRNESDNEEEISNRSSPNNMSDNEAESDSRSSSRNDENEDSHSVKASESDENDASPEREIYVPTKIKREKESPPRLSKTSSDKNKSSHSRSHSNYSSSHNSSSRSKNDKVSSNKKEGFENLKIKKEKDENENSRKRREEKSSDKKSHKSSNSDSGIKESNKNEKKVKIKIEKQDDGSIDCGSGASFADALMGLSEPKKKSAKRKSTPTTPEKPSKSVEKTAEVKSKSLIKTEPRVSSSSSSSSKTAGFKEPDLLSKNVKLEPLDVDLKSTLPEISPHYKPLPHYSPPGSPAGKRSKLQTQEEALCTIMTTKNQRTKVYSGNKTGYLKVPSLFDLCIQVLRDNIEALEYTGGVPYDLLKPVLDRATAAQLFQLEHYNPYLVEDTDGLWKFHCNKDFRGKERDEFESWRELYVRLLDERERKLEALKANITQSMAKNTPVRQTKLAYVDSVVKPPRNVAKKQMKFGTGKAVKHELVSKAMVGAASGSPATAAVPVPAPPVSARGSYTNPNAFPIPNFLKKKKAPLMQKTLQLIKGNRFKR